MNPNYDPTYLSELGQSLADHQQEQAEFEDWYDEVDNWLTEVSDASDPANAALEEITEYTPEIPTAQTQAEHDLNMHQLGHLLKGHGFIRDFVDTYSPIREAPDEGFVGVALSLMAAAIGQGMKVEFGDDDLNLNMYMMLIAESGDHKSSLLGTINRYLKTIGGLGRLGSDFTDAALEEKLMDTPNLHITVDEYAMLYEQGQTATGAKVPKMLTEIYGGRMVLKGRKTKTDFMKAYEEEHGCLPEILETTVNIAAASTPQWLDGLNLSHFRSGELSRWLLIWLPRSDKRISIPRKASPKQIARLHQAVDQMQLLGGTATLSEEAYAYWDEWYCEYLDSFSDDVQASVIKPLWRRLGPVALKLAALLEISDMPRNSPVIGLDNLRRAIAVVDGNIRVIRQKLDEGMFKMGDQAMQNRIIQWLHANGSGTICDLQEPSESSLRDTDTVLQYMVKSGILTVHTFNEGKVEVFALNKSNPTKETTSNV